MNKRNGLLVDVEQGEVHGNTVAESQQVVRHGGDLRVQVALQSVVLALVAVREQGLLDQGYALIAISAKRNFHNEPHFLLKQDLVEIRVVIQHQSVTETVD